jgi:hypothetical protein
METIEKVYEMRAIHLITGQERYSGKLIIRSRRGGITSTTPPIPAEVSHKKLAHWLQQRLSQSDKIVVTTYDVNFGGIVDN